MNQKYRTIIKLWHRGSTHAFAFHPSLINSLFTAERTRLPARQPGVYLSFLHIEVVNDDTNEEVECEEGTKDDEDDEKQVESRSALLPWLQVNLQHSTTHTTYDIFQQ
jgi:hypothetical protein